MRNQEVAVAYTSDLLGAFYLHWDTPQEQEELVARIRDRVRSGQASVINVGTIEVEDVYAGFGKWLTIDIDGEVDVWSKAAFDKVFSRVGPKVTADA